MECIWSISGIVFSCYSIIMAGLVLDILGAILIAIPLWNLKKRFKEEFDLEVSKKEYLDSKKNESISMRKPNKKSDEIIDVLTDLSSTFMHGIWAIKDQRYVRIGIIFLVIGFLLQITGDVMQHWNFVENYA